MRVIKFMAWHKVEKKMYPVAGMLQDIILLMVSDGCLQSVDISDIELMQFTGAVDKNDKEVYEGYILQEIFMDKPLEWSLWQIVFENAAFIIRSLVLEDEVEPPLSFEDERLAGFTVIGNIYENPELVKS